MTSNVNNQEHFIELRQRLFFVISAGCCCAHVKAHFKAESHPGKHIAGNWMSKVPTILPGAGSSLCESECLKNCLKENWRPLKVAAPPNNHKNDELHYEGCIAIGALFPLPGKKVGCSAKAARSWQMRVRDPGVPRALALFTML